MGKGGKTNFLSTQFSTLHSFAIHCGLITCMAIWFYGKLALSKFRITHYKIHFQYDKLALISKFRITCKIQFQLFRFTCNIHFQYEVSFIKI